MTNGLPMQLWDCSATNPNQWWHDYNVSNGMAAPATIIAGDNPLKCITAQNGNTNGSPIVISDCTQAQNQQFTSYGGTVMAYNGAKCLDVVGGVDSNGVQLQLWDCIAQNGNQRWTGSVELCVILQIIPVVW